MQLETVRLERQWQASLAATIRDIETASKQEETAIANETRRLASDISQAMTRKDQMLAMTSAIQEKMVDISKQIEKGIKERQQLQTKLSKAQEHMENLNQIQSRHAQHEEEIFQYDLQQLQMKYDQLTRQLSQRSEQHDDAIDRMKSNHEQQLEKLDSDVKSALKEKESTINHLREDISCNTEIVNRLKALIKQYQ